MFCPVKGRNSNPNSTLFVIHPNLSIKDKYVIHPLNLIELLKIKKELIYALDSSRTQENRDNIAV
jgi:hypothetical protein